MGRGNDVLFRRSGGRGGAHGQVNARYGNDPGGTFYTHVSDQYSPFYTKLINTTVRDATHVLDGLLYHESKLQIEEHYTDTAGFTDHVFALCHLLGFRFAPRIRHVGETRLFSIERPAARLWHSGSSPNELSSSSGCRVHTLGVPAGIGRRTPVGH